MKRKHLRTSLLKRLPLIAPVKVQAPNFMIVFENSFQRDLLTPFCKNMKFLTLDPPAKIRDLLFVFTGQMDAEKKN